MDGSTADQVCGCRGLKRQRSFGTAVEEGHTDTAKDTRIAVTLPAEVAVMMAEADSTVGRGERNRVAEQFVAANVAKTIVRVYLPGSEFKVRKLDLSRASWAILTTPWCAATPKDWSGVHCA